MYKLLSDYSDYYYKNAHSGLIDSSRYIPAVEYNGVRYIAKMTVVIAYEQIGVVKTQFNFEQAQFPDEMIEKIYADYLAKKDEYENTKEKNDERD